MAAMKITRQGDAPTPAVEVRHVNRTFRSAGSTVQAVRDVSIAVPRGELLAIVGRSGSGKTTLLNVIAGLDKPDSGEVFIDGEEVSSYGDGRLTELRRHKIGFVFQSFGLLPLLSAAENVELALRIAGASLRVRTQRTRELLERVGLTERSDHRPYELSGGEQQRAAVARSLANEPQLVIADEPTGELDSTTGAQIFALLREVSDSGVTVITATHDPFVIEHVDRVIEMTDGAIANEGMGQITARHAPDAPELPRMSRPPKAPPPR